MALSIDELISENKVLGPIYRRGLEEGRQEALQEGRQEGRQEGQEGIK
jgi:predicted transposase YdaD